jgi:hypothetical protein
LIPLLLSGVFVIFVSVFGAAKAGLPGVLASLTVAVAMVPVSARFAPGLPNPVDAASIIAIAAILFFLPAKGVLARILGGFACALAYGFDPAAGTLVLLGAAVGDLMRGISIGGEKAVLKGARLHAAASLLGLAINAFIARANETQGSSVAVAAGVILAGILLLELLASLSAKGSAASSPRTAYPLRFFCPAAALLLTAATLLALQHWAPDIALNRAAQRPFTLPGSGEETNLLRWLVRVGGPWENLSLCMSVGLPLILIAATEAGKRSNLLKRLAPFAALLGFAFFHPAYLGVATLFLIAPAVELFASSNRRSSSLLALPAVFAAVLFCLQIKVDPVAASPRELRGLIERDLAHWVRTHSDDKATLLAPPDLSTALRYFGGLRVLGSSSPANRKGLEALTAIASSTSAEEAQALISEHEVTHIIIPSWDSDLQRFAAWTLHKKEDAFINALTRWAIPPFLRPRSYQLPALPGFEAPSALILEVRAESDRAASAADFAEYFLDTRQPQLAADIAVSLRLFPNDIAALAALARVQRESGDKPGFEKTHGNVTSMLRSSYPPRISWTHRVSLAFLLAQTGDEALSIAQTKLCLQQSDEAKIRSLDPIPLFKLLKLSELYNLKFASEDVHELARALLPGELREKLAGSPGGS